MKIAFLQETVNQSIGVMYLSSLIKKEGHSAELFVESLEDNFLESVVAASPDVIGFGIITGAHHWVLEQAQALKNRLPKALIVVGGPHPTYFPEMVEEAAIDAVFRGESEIAFPEFIRRRAHNASLVDTPGVWMKNTVSVHRNAVAPLVEDISSLPQPDHGLYLKYDFFRRQSEVPFSTARGCPYRCSFCYNHAKARLYEGKGKYVRLRSVSNVIAEMEYARTVYPNMRSIILYDDIIGVDKLWLSEFSRAYADRINLPWFTSIRADVVDEFVAQKLKEANCFCLSVGLETGDEELREKVLCKRIPNARYVHAVGLLKAQGIKVRTSNMLFLPDEDYQLAVKTVDLNRAMHVDFAWAYTLQPYPGTDIYEYALKMGYLPAGFQFDDIDPLGLVKPIVRVKDQKKILVIHRLFHYFIHTPLRGLLPVLVRIPPNPVFDALYYYSLILSYAQYHQVSIWRAFQVAWTNYWGTRTKKRSVTR